MSEATSVTIGELAGTRPASIRVFQRHGIDFCCGGGKPLSEVCAKKGKDPAQLLEEIAAEEQVGAGDLGAWTSRPLAELIEYIVGHHHERLREDLRRLEGMALKVLRVHGAKDPERLHALSVAIHDLREEMEPHLDKEEQVLFPSINAGRGAMVGGPIQVMRRDHDTHGEQLAELRRLTDDYKVPAQACTTWRALWEGLADLDTGLQEHIHLENNVLFPRALAGN